MGAGKSSVALGLSKRKGWGVIDTDASIERVHGRSIDDLFVRDGETAFRDYEHNVLSDLNCDNTIISTGGGMVLRQDNRPLLKSLGIVVWLQVSQEMVFRRLKYDTTRPLLKRHDWQEEVRKLLLIRNPIYAEVADITVSTDRDSVNKIVNNIISKLAVIGHG